jgi:large subunit ribosomal protein L31
MECRVMKPEIHPKYNKEAKVSCVCGNTFTTGSVLNEINTDICSACHPFFSGKQKMADMEGRVEKFKKKYASFYDQKKA